MKLKDIMNRDVEFITGQATLCMAAERMKHRKIGALPVIENGKLSGIITDRDIVVRALALHKNPLQERVHEFMTAAVIHSYEDQDVKDAVQVMAEHHFRRLPVLSRAGTLVGIVTRSDLLRARKAQT